MSIGALGGTPKEIPGKKNLNESLKHLVDFFGPKVFGAQLKIFQMQE